MALTSFGVLDSAFGRDGIAVAEAGGPVRCFDHDGAERWRWSPPPGEHVLRLAWAAHLDRFCGVLFP